MRCIGRVKKLPQPFLLAQEQRVLSGNIELPVGLVSSASHVTALSAAVDFAYLTMSIHAGSVTARGQESLPYSPKAILGEYERNVTVIGEFETLAPPSLGIP